MKEIIDSINLPKQIIDKADKFMSALLGPAVKEMGELFADKIKSKRLVNQIKIFNNAASILEKNGLKANPLSLKTLVPLIEKASLDEDENLQEKWSNLIANIASSPETGLEPRLINTLSSLSSYEASIIDFIFKIFEIERQKMFDRSFRDFVTFSIEDIRPEGIYIHFEKVKKEFSLDYNFCKIYIDNLQSLGIIRYEEPVIEIQNGSSEGEIDYDIEGKVNLELDVSANYIQSEDFHITAYGKYFIEQCKNNKTTL